MADAIWNNRFILADPGKNETVLFSGDTRLAEDSTITLSENLRNFEIAKIYFRNNDNYRGCSEFIVNQDTTDNKVTSLVTATPLSNDYCYMKSIAVWVSSDGKTLSTPANPNQLRWPKNNATVSFTSGQADNTMRIMRVVGINRISGGNS